MPRAATRRPIVFLHGYSDDGRAFNAWREALTAAGWQADQLITLSYESLTNDISVRDIAEGLDALLAAHPLLANNAPFDCVVHSTGMLVLRAWLTRPGACDARLARLRHCIALAPATFGSPLAHKGRSFLGALIKGRKTPGPDFLEAGDQILDALEIGGRFAWQLADCDLFGTQQFYDRSRRTPYLFVFCGTRGFRGLGAIANEPGTDGVVRWAGCALTSRKIVLDLTDACDANARVQVAEWTHDDVALTPIAGADHVSLLSAPSPLLVQLVVDAMQVDGPTAYTAWQQQAAAATQEAHDALTPWQQFFVRAIDERGDGIPDWNLQLALANGTVLQPFAQDVHVYRGDPSYRSFHVNLDRLTAPALRAGRNAQLAAHLIANTGTARVQYRGALTHSDGDASPATGTWSGTLDLGTVLPGGSVRLFHPLTTTFLELRLDRVPRTGPGMVIRVDPG